jgi:hypothetical protein
VVVVSISSTRRREYINLSKFMRRSEAQAGRQTEGFSIRLQAESFFPTDRIKLLFEETDLISKCCF